MKLFGRKASSARGADRQVALAVPTSRSVRWSGSVPVMRRVDARPTPYFCSAAAACMGEAVAPTPSPSAGYAPSTARFSNGADGLCFSASQSLSSELGL